MSNHFASSKFRPRTEGRVQSCSLLNSSVSSYLCRCIVKDPYTTDDLQIKCRSEGGHSSIECLHHPHTRVKQYLRLECIQARYPKNNLRKISLVNFSPVIDRSVHGSLGEGNSCNSVPAVKNLLKAFVRRSVSQRRRMTSIER